jgi:hypothetical protein
MKPRAQIPGLINEDFIQLFPTLAVRAGINKAAILQKLYFLVHVTENTKNEANHFEGRWWVYNTYAEWQEQYFPWLTVGTVKRLFLELEEDKIVLYHPLNKHAKKKYYTIDEEFWPTWLNRKPSQKKTNRNRHKKRRLPSQKETISVTKESDESTQNVPMIGTKRDGSSIYKDSENTQKRLSETTQTTPTTSAPDSTAPAGAVVGDDEIQFILPEIQKIGLTPDAQTRLLALGPQTALAIAFAAQKPGVRSPAALAVHLMTNGGPSEADLVLAGQALKTRCLDREAADLQARKEEWAALNESTMQFVAEEENQAQPPGEAPSPPADGLDTIPDGCRLTILDSWRAALGSLSLQLNRSNYEWWVKGTKPLSFANGVLTVQAKTLMAREMLTRYGWLAPAVTKAAGAPIQVRVVLREEVGA